MTMHTPAAISATDVTVRRRTWPGLCTFIQPLIGVRQVTRGFCFFEASVLLIEQGSLAFDAGDHQGVAGGPDSLLCVDQDYRCDMIKTPDADSGVFQSLFICIDEAVISEFALQQRVSGVVKAPQARTVPLDDVLADTWRFTLRALEEGSTVSHGEVRHRLLGLLLALSVRGKRFRVPTQRLATRIRTLLSGDPSHPWTAVEVGRHVAMSEATLRRRLAQEGELFQTILQDVRLHHALILLQTTAQSIGQIAVASGYQSASRFSLRFRLRFGHLPSAMR